MSQLVPRRRASDAEEDKRSLDIARKRMENIRLRMMEADIPLDAGTETEEVIGLAETALRIGAIDLQLQSIRRNQK